MFLTCVLDLCDGDGVGGGDTMPGEFQGKCWCYQGFCEAAGAGRLFSISPPPWRMGPARVERFTGGSRVRKTGSFLALLSLPREQPYVSTLFAPTSRSPNTHLFFQLFVLSGGYVACCFFCISTLSWRPAKGGTRLSPLYAERWWAGCI